MCLPLVCCCGIVVVTWVVLSYAVALLIGLIVWRQVTFGGGLGPVVPSDGSGIAVLGLAQGAFVASIVTIAQLACVVVIVFCVCVLVSRASRRDAERKILNTRSRYGAV